MDLKGFLKENNGFPENKRVRISPCFRENGEEVLWELRAVSEEEYRRAAEGKRDKWAVLCMLSVVVPDLTRAPAINNTKSCFFLIVCPPIDEF